MRDTNLNMNEHEYLEIGDGSIVSDLKQIKIRENKNRKKVGLTKWV